MPRFIGSSKSNAKLIKLITAAIDARKIPYLIGEPGIGKTALVEALADRYNAQVRTLVGSTIDPVDLMGYPRIGHNSKGEAIAENTMPDWLDSLTTAAEEDGISFLFLDEFTTSPPAVQAGFLTITQSRKVGKYSLHENIVIICAANPPSQAADGWVLAPPMANRLFHINIKPNKDDWCEGMLVNWNKPMTEREQTIRSFIVAFHRGELFEFLQVIPEDPDEAGGAWPSMRSWDNAATIIAQSDDSILKDVLQGCVGLKAANAYTTWAARQKLPPYETVLNSPETLPWTQYGADQTQLILSQCVQQMNTDNILATLNVFRVAEQEGKKTTICASLAFPVAKKVKVLTAEIGPEDAVTGKNYFTETLAVFGKYTTTLSEALAKPAKEIPSSSPTLLPRSDNKPSLPIPPFTRPKNPLNTY